MISGVISGFFGVGIGSLVFITSYNYLTQLIYAQKKIKPLNNLDFRLKNLIIFSCSDVVATFFKLPFEARKQLVQMANYNLDLKIIMRNSQYALMPLMFRDVFFRFTIQSTYYLTTHVEHKPILRYSVPQIMDFMK